MKEEETHEPRGHFQQREQHMQRHEDGKQPRSFGGLKVSWHGCSTAACK